MGGGCAGSSLPCGLSLVMEIRGYSLVAVGELLTVVASLVAKHGLQDTQASVVEACGLSSCSSWAQEHRLDSCGLFTPWHLPRPGDQTHVPCIGRWILYH